MSEVFNGYERQYCDLSANLSKKCSSALSLDGGKTISKTIGYLVSVFDTLLIDLQNKRSRSFPKSNLALKLQRHWYVIRHVIVLLTF